MNILDAMDDIVTNERGGKQAHIASRLTLMPPKAMLAVGEVLAKGAKKYGIDNWKLISWQEHADHALEHIYKHLKGEGGEPHIAHFTCRAMMALEMYLEEQEADNGTI